ncbi:MAG: hypothetical protein DI598_12525 [Pseudopedobacter saltans]|uniref:Anti-FecI sigma factor, FecR n=1 Tax=Pseudopedobacter saltans TaxID=151895 RepID=A0A2W5EVX8_9SPHI|nr:MAG: hypothetical protein DI598_12525 [Pseudopedobacter saltans]
MSDYIIELIIKEFKSTISKDELFALIIWRNSKLENEENYTNFVTLLEDCLVCSQYNSINVDKAWTRVENKLSKFDANVRKAVTFQKYWIAAAAVFLCGLFALTWIYLNNRIKEPFEQSVLQTPGKLQQKAYIQFSNGTQQDLTRLSGNLKTNNGIVIGRNSNGQLRMDSSDDLSDLKQDWVDVIVPNKSNYCLVLSDGSKVVLNSGSRLHYPTRFSNKLRQVELHGEAYFDIKKDSMPFVVISKGIQTKVLGTAFNISSYSNESLNEVTLERGRVEILYQSKSYFLMPGKQFQESSGNAFVKEVDTRQYTSWRFGVVRFYNLELSEIAKKIERWYDVKFVFQDFSTSNLHFTGEVDQNVKLGDLLRMIEMMNNVKFVIRGNVITATRNT